MKNSQKKRTIPVITKPSLDASDLAFKNNADLENSIVDHVTLYLLTQDELANILVEQPVIEESLEEIQGGIFRLIEASRLTTDIVENDVVLRISGSINRQKSRIESVKWLNQNLVLGKLFDKAKQNYVNIIKKAEKNNANHFNQALESQNKSTHIITNEAEYISFTTNDYLGLSNHPHVIKSATEALQNYGNSTCCARVAGGTTPLHKTLESEIAAFLESESAVLFNAGYLASLAISEILDKDDAVICDRLNHASIFDGIKMSHAKLYRFKHNCTKSLEIQLKRIPKEKNKVVFIEGIYSMEGDIAPLPEIISLVERYNAYLFVDEAHSIGCLGETGKGIFEHFGIDPNKATLRMGTFSKSFGSIGGFVVGRKLICDMLRYSSRQYIFTASLAPSIVSGATKAVSILNSSPELTKKLQKTSKSFIQKVIKAGFDVGNTTTQIIPIIIGDEEKACRVHKYLLEKGIYTTSVIYPVVPKGAARIRIGITTDHTEEELEKLLGTLLQMKYVLNNFMRI